MDVPAPVPLPHAPDAPVQLVTYRLTASAPVTGATNATRAESAAAPGPAQIQTRRVHFRESGGFVECPIYDRTRINASQAIPGPAILEQMDTTTVVLPGQTARAQANGNLLLTFG